MIIQSNEGVCFYVSLGLLAKHSSFFDNLASLSDLFSTQNKDQVLELPSASTQAVREVLSLLHNNTPTEWFLQHIRSQNLYEACEVFKGTAILADAYDLSGVLEGVYDHVLESRWLRYSLAAISGDEDRAKAASTDLILLDKGYYPMMIPFTIGNLLSDLAPGYLKRLEDLLTTRRAAWNECKIAIRHNAPIFNDLNDFGKKCYQSGGCAAVLKFGGSFKKMRRRAAYCAIKAVERSPSLYELSDAMGSGIDEEIRCGSCFFRMLKTFEIARTKAFQGVGLHI